MKAALVVSHPGHELRVHGWLHRVRPTVYVLTDGSGRAGRTRVEATRRIVEGASAIAGDVFGRISDNYLYDTIIAGRYEPLLAITDDLVRSLRREKFDFVLVDALEGYDPAHDLVNVMTHAAVRGLEGCATYDFTLLARPDECPRKFRHRAIWLRLSDDELARKLEAARAYTALRAEVETSLDTMGEEAFRTECLRPLADPVLPETPYYEQQGERQVAAGYYAQVLRARQHFAPLMREIVERAAKN